MPLNNPEHQLHSKMYISHEKINENANLKIYVLDPKRCRNELTKNDKAGDEKLHGPDNRQLPTKLLVDHESENAHHRRASVIQLDGPLGQLRLVAEGIPSEVDCAVSEVAHELVPSTRDVLHDARLQESDEEEDLRDAILGNGIGSVDGSPAGAEGAEGMTSVVDIAR
jgi:hypothetical protein